MIQPFWTLPCLCVLRYWPGVIHNAWGTYAVTAVLLAYPYCRKCLKRARFTTPESNSQIIRRDTRGMVIQELKQRGRERRLGGSLQRMHTFLIVR